jgi:hypothetical protein
VHHAGAVPRAADGIDWDSVWTIGKTFETIRFSFPGRRDRVFWPEDALGAPSGWSAFWSVEHVLAWLPPPAEGIPARIINTQSLGLRSSRAFSGILMAQLQDKRMRATKCCLSIIVRC